MSVYDDTRDSIVREAALELIHKKLQAMSTAELLRILGRLEQQGY